MLASSNVVFTSLIILFYFLLLFVICQIILSLIWFPCLLWASFCPRVQVIYLFIFWNLFEIFSCTISLQYVFGYLVFNQLFSFRIFLSLFSFITPLFRPCVGSFMTVVHLWVRLPKSWPPICSTDMGSCNELNACVLQQMRMLQPYPLMW